MSQTSTGDVDLVGDETALNIARAALFAALMGAFAYVSFPFPGTPVPVTLQVLGVFLAGILLGPVWGGAAMVLYLAAGAVGAPVFSGGSAGIGVLLGPTGGYLVSYPVAAAVVGAAVHRTDGLSDPENASLTRLVGGMVAGTAVIYALGILVYWQSLNVGLVEAVVGAAVVFVPVEALKIAAAVGIVRSDEITAA